ncbi:MAG: 3-oxoacyl-ACP synthase III family protein, partial [Bdellovibrionota bacterium]
TPQFRPNGPFDCASEIVALARWTPDKVLTSKDLDNELRNSDAKIDIDLEKLTGVVERRVADEGMSVLEMAAAACEKLFTKTDVKPSMVDLVIFCSISKDCMEPAMASLVCKRIGINRAKSFDLSNACLGFVDAWMTADAMIQAGRSRLCLVVGAEKSSHCWKIALEQLKNGCTDPASLLPALTLGDGSAAMLIGTRLDRPGSLIAKAGIRESYGEYSDLCIVKDVTTPMVTNSKGLFRAALKRGPALAKELLKYLRWHPLRIDMIIPHQASIKIIETATKQMYLPESKVKVTMDRFGNLASVAVPFTLSEAMDDENLAGVKNILIMGYGSGLGVGLIGLEKKK